jgi:hypothetical protein
MTIKGAQVMVDASVIISTPAEQQHDFQAFD